MGLAERKRQVVRDELTDAALQLVAFQGFEETTVEQIVAKAGVSRRTFFRYFRSKEDVLVQFLDDLGAEICADLRARPAEEPPAEAVRAALLAFTEHHRAYPEKAVGLSRTIYYTPALRARFVERQDHWRADLTAELAARTGAAPDDLRPALAATVAISTLDVAMARWIATGGTEDPSAVLSDALSLVDGVLRDITSTKGQI